MPGIRRGYVIVPYSARSGKTESQCQERLRGAMSRVRRANILTGDDGPEGPRHLWLNFSTSPDRRKKAILAGNIKRAVLEAGRRKDQLEVEFARASVWFRGKGGRWGNSTTRLGHTSRVRMGGRERFVRYAGGGLSNKMGTPLKGLSIDYVILKMHALPSHRTCMRG